MTDTKIINSIIHFRSTSLRVVNLGGKSRKRKKRTNNPTRKSNIKTRKSYNNYGKKR